MGIKTFFYKTTEIGDKAFPDDAQIKIPFLASRLIISNDSEKKLSFSFSPPDIHGDLFRDDNPIVFDGISFGKIWFKAEENSNVRVWAWRL